MFYVYSVLCSSDLDVFFFFKQKTAYEMRISDWSSDVCSSDLGRVSLDTGDLGGSGFMAKLSYVHKQSDGYVDNLNVKSSKDPEIGRASCRERVCQYV